MRYSFNWLKEWIDIPVDAPTLARELTMVGLQLQNLEEADGDTILDLEITVNRPDCLSLLGLSREIATVFGLPSPSLPKLQAVEIIRSEKMEGLLGSAGVPAKIVLEDPELCPRYCGQIFTGMKIRPSPRWIVLKLEASGLRSVNNVVDITNLVMLELGQPLHAFDYGKLSEGTIRVRRARNEKLPMIDGHECLLSDPMLVIADAHRAQAVAGVMGGKDSEVSEKTTTVLLESAYFQPASVRTTAKALELSTDASYRFERGVDYDLQAIACQRAATLLEEIAGGKAHPILDVCAHRFESHEIELRPRRVERVLGAKIDAQFINTTLTALGFQKTSETRWKVPSFRVDIFREIDLIEEVARHYGYNKFPDTLPKAEKKYQPDYATYELERILSNFLRGAGFDEAYTYSFVGASAAADCAPLQQEIAGSTPVSSPPADETQIAILNPISETARLLRMSLIPNLLESVGHNLRHRNREIRLFEIGRIFPKEGEKVALGIVMLGEYQDLKGVIEAALPTLGYAKPTFQKGCILIEGKPIGEFQQTTVDSHPVQVCEISLSDLIQLPKQTAKYHPIIPFPFVERDISLIVDETIPYADLEAVFQKLPMKDLRSYKLVDRYHGKNVPDGKVSLTFQLIFQSENRTLTSEEVDSIYEKIVREFETRFAAQLRA